MAGHLLGACRRRRKRKSGPAGFAFISAGLPGRPLVRAFPGDDVREERRGSRRGWLVRERLEDASLIPPTPPTVPQHRPSPLPRNPGFFPRISGERLGLVLLTSTGTGETGAVCKRLLRADLSKSRVRSDRCAHSGEEALHTLPPNPVCTENARSGSEDRG